VTILYGRRRFGVTVLTGFVVHGLYTLALGSSAAPAADLRVVGYIVPGLIANTSLSQGFWPTIGATLAIALIVRVLLAALAGVVA
jgi:uncharacterized membrane protein